MQLLQRVVQQQLQEEEEEEAQALEQQWVVLLVLERQLGTHHLVPTMKPQARVSTHQQQDSSDGIVSISPVSSIQYSAMQCCILEREEKDQQHDT